MTKTKELGAQATVPQDEAERVRREKTAAFIERMLVERGINQLRLSELTGIGTSYLGLVRKKLRGIGIDSTNKIAEGLGLPAWYVARECGLLPDAPDEAGETNPLKASIRREIDQEEDPEVLRRIYDVLLTVKSWNKEGKGDEAPESVPEKKREPLRAEKLALAI